MARVMTFLSVLLLPLAGGSNCVLAEPPLAALTADQQRRISELANSTQAEAKRIKAELEAAQRELAGVYAVFELDATRAAQLEAKVLDLQRQMLANYRQMQTELRTLVSKERFTNLKRRLDGFLQVSRADVQESSPASPPARQPRAEPAPPPAAKAANNSPADRVFSGPQVGEKLPPLPVRGVYDEEAGKSLDFVTAAGRKPIVLVFVHEMNRPTIAMTRALTAYSKERAKDGLTTGIVWLDDDATEAENTLKRIRHALTPGVPVGISPDGKEGPGSYGLNRNVALTILVGNEGRVTANFALVQPSIQTDLPKVFEEIVRIVGGKAPSPEALGGREMMRDSATAASDPKLPGLLRPVIQRDASEEAVDRAAAAVESYLENNKAAQTEVGRIANTIVSSGRLSNYGTPRAQEYLRKWSKQFGQAGANPSREQKTPPAEKSKAQSPQSPSR